MNASSAEQQELICCSQMGKISLLHFSLSFPSPHNSSIPPALFANHVAKTWLLHFLYFFFLKKEKSSRLPQVKELCYSTNELPLLFPLSPHLQNSVEHYWSGVLVCRLGHMTEDIFFCYNAKEASIVSYKALPQTQLSENIHHNLHWGVVCHGERAHVKNASKL